VFDVYPAAALAFIEIGDVGVNVIDAVKTIVFSKHCVDVVGFTSLEYESWCIPGP
jgi:hypothetical protein